MLYSFFSSLVDSYSFLNVFKYITVRIALSVITSFLIVFLIGEPLIKIFKRRQISGPIRQDGPIDHIIKKSGTPTMGGLIIILGIFLGTSLWADLKNIYVLTVIFISLSLGLLGFIDDLLKIKLRNSRGLNSKLKLIGQLFIALIAIFILSQYSNHQYLNNLYFPFLKNVVLPMGIFFIPFTILVIVGSSNAVNLTDGLDGLATVPVMLVALSFTLISYIVGNTIFAEYLKIPYIADVGELSIFCGAIFGSCLGFLWYNAPPAKIFMGDTGSLSLGGSLAAVAIIVKHEIVLAIIGGLFFL
jgi:phospho-N-acetylmuramoyl-pentapeptide-transferase